MRNAARNRCADRTVNVSDPLSSSPTDPGSIMIDVRSRTAATVVALAPLLVGCGAAGPGDGAGRRAGDRSEPGEGSVRSRSAPIHEGGRTGRPRRSRTDRAGAGRSDRRLCGRARHVPRRRIRPHRAHGGHADRGLRRCRGRPHPRDVHGVHPHRGGGPRSRAPRRHPTALYLSQVARLPATFEGPVWVPVSPQGFIVEAHGTATFPMAPDLDDSQRLAEQVPGDVTVPD